MKKLCTIFGAFFPSLITLQYNSLAQNTHNLSTSSFENSVAACFMDQLFGDLGDLVKDEDHLRDIWSNPETRVQFLKVLVGRGYDGDRLDDMKRLIDAPNSDVFDVLSASCYECCTFINSIGSSFVSYSVIFFLLF